MVKIYKKILNKLFEIVWWKRIHGTKEIHKYYKTHCWLVSPFPYKVIRVKGWRTAIVETKSGNRMTQTYLFSWEE